jgi:hypothetical protein
VVVFTEESHSFSDGSVAGYYSIARADRPQGGDILLVRTPRSPFAMRL